MTLLDLLLTMPYLGEREAIRFFNGFRTWKLSYRQLYARIAAFTCYLDQKGFHKGDRILLWGENRIEWVAVFWGCLARGVQVVPADVQSSRNLVKRIQGEVGAKLLVYGDLVQPEEIKIPKLSFRQVERLPPSRDIKVQEVSPSDIVEIVYTSGTTAEPKGVVHRHRNICANLRPFQSEIRRYQQWARVFQPIRILDMLPLSHMYGQSLGMFIPLLLGGAVVFMLELSPAAIIESIRRERISVLVAVPRLVKNLQNQIERRLDLPTTQPRISGMLGVAQRWWRYRRVHSLFGWKFWSMAVGGAHLDSQSEAFWRKMGFLILQGYGLTETSPVVTVNHPFKSRHGSIGQVLEGQEVQIAPDGEILVRGDSVVDEYLGNEAHSRLSEEGWFHTGDLGEMDEEGYLYYKGRKKDVIVTSEGLNVYPQDVESVLNNFPEIHASAVIGLPKDGNELVHAVLILRDPPVEIDTLIHRANRQLEAHQRIRSWSIWPEEEFPRTPSTLKVKRHEVVQRTCASLEGDTTALARGGVGGMEGILSQMTGSDPSELVGNRRLDEDLGLSSLEQVDLLSQLESKMGLDLDEAEFARLSTVGELKAWLEGQTARLEETSSSQSIPLTVPHQPYVAPSLPRWNQLAVTRWVRKAILQFFILPIFHRYIKLRVEGLEHLRKVQPPVIFVANHVSHLDTLAVISALPSPWRWRLAPAMAQEFFRPLFQPKGVSFKERTVATSQYLLACGLFNAYPLPQEMRGVRRVLQYTGQLIERGNCPLVFPEGKRSPQGDLLTFKSGIGFMALRLQVKVVPINLEGLYDIYSIHHEWPQSGEVQVRIGPALSFEDEQDYQVVTRTVEEAVRSLKA